MIRYMLLETLPLRNTVLEICSKRMDAWSLEVSRLQLCIDLPAADAVYHELCYSRFFTGWKHPQEEPSVAGRPDDDCKLKSFNDLCDWFETCDDLCSLVEMRERMVSKTGNEDAVYFVKTLKRKLLERYGDHIFFGEIRGRHDVVCLVNMASYIINNKWYSEKKEDFTEETKRIVSSATQLIRSEIIWPSRYRYPFLS